MPKTPASEKPYGLDPRFERAVVVQATRSPKFWVRGPNKLDPALLVDDTNRLILETVRAMVAEGHPPDSFLAVVQRLKRQVGLGKVTFEQLQEAAEAMDAAIDAGLPSEDVMLNELVPVVQERMMRAALRQGISTLGVRGDMTDVAEKLQEALKVGATDEQVVTKGTRTGSATLDIVNQLQRLVRLSTGIPELDAVAGGGLHRGGLGVALGGPGGGKSMFLSHVGCTAYLLGLHVLYATLELPPPLVHARIIANLCEIPIDDVLGARQEEARDKLVGIENTFEKNKVGIMEVREFTPQATTIQQLFDWEDESENNASRPVDLLLVDYADKLISKNNSARAGGNRHAGDYLAMRDVYEGLRVRSVEKHRWCWTASQPRRKDSYSRKAKDLADLDDFADSMHKARVPDLVITLNPNDEDRTMVCFVAKNRVGEGRRPSEPFSTDFACGRFCPNL